MKRLVAVLLSLAIGFTLAASAEKHYVTLDEFADKYKEAITYINAILARNAQPSMLQLGYTTDGSELLSFAIEEKEFTIQGNAFPDTGVISSLLVSVKKNDEANVADQLSLAGVFYGMSEFENFATSIVDPKFVKMAEDMAGKMERGGTYGDYKIEALKLDGMAGLAGNFSFTFNGNPPSPKEVPNAQNIAFYAEKYMGSTANGGVKTLSSGEYIVGDHIAAGEYTIKAETNAYIGVTRSGQLKINEALGDDNEIGRAVLKDGDEIEIKNGRVIFTKIK